MTPDSYVMLKALKRMSEGSLKPRKQGSEALVGTFLHKSEYPRFGDIQPPPYQLFSEKISCSFSPKKLRNGF